MDELTLYLKETFIEELHNIDWMDEQTKRRAVEKANFIEYKSGYPAWLFNDTWMQDNWGLVRNHLLKLSLLYSCFYS